MGKQNNDAVTGAEKVRWDLSEMYLGVNDPQIDTDLTALIQRAEKFHATYKGNLASTLGNAISDYAVIEMSADKLLIFLFLLQSTDVANAEVKAKIADV